LSLKEVAMKRSWWLLGLLAASCGAGDDAPDETFADGSRLRAFWDQAPGAPRRHRLWYDSELASPCAFFPDAARKRDGVMRCLPTSSSSIGAFHQFADAGCTEPAIATATRWFWLTESADCGAAVTRVFELGDPVAPDSVFQDGPEGCVPATDLPANLLGYRRLGREIAVDTLVSAEAPRAEGTGRLTSYRRDAGDGSWILMPYGHDAVLSADVSPERARGRWQPLSDLIVTPDASAFSDSACTMPVARPLGCQRLNYVFVDSPSTSLSGPATCPGAPPARRVHRAGPTIDAASVYRYTGSVCASGGGSDDGAFVAVGAPVADHEMTALSTTLVGSGRVQLQWLGGPDSPFVTTGGYEDTLLHTPCAAAPAADGVSRCLPPALPAGPYADPGCTVPAVEVTAGCAAPTLTSMRTSTDGGLRAFQLQPDPLAAIYVRDASAVCVPLVGALDHVYLAVGAEVPASTFMEMTIFEPL
jgi:hypothetical protein